MQGINSLGYVTIIFNDDIAPIANFSNWQYFNDSVLSVIIVPGMYSDKS